MHVGLGPGVRLTRREWGAVRRALGRPRRLSLAFLRQERAKLETYRNIVRAKYEEVRPQCYSTHIVQQPTSRRLLLADACSCMASVKQSTSCAVNLEVLLLLGRWATATRRRRRCPSRCTWGSA